MKIFHLTAIVLLFWSSAPGWAVENPSAPSTASRDLSVQPYEGYLFLDDHGNPLPFQTDAEILQFLATAEVVGTEVLPTGVTLPKKVTLAGDGFRANAVFKDVDIEKHRVTEIINGRNRFSLDWRDWHGYDAAAFELDRLLGINRVPPSVPRTIDGKSGTICVWLEGTINDVERSRKLGIDPPNERRWLQQRSIMQVFDNLVANRDSNLGNKLIDANWRLWFIDCTRCFGTTRVMYYPLEKIRSCEREFWHGLQSLDLATLKEHLAPLLSKTEMKALLVRRDTIVQHFQKLIDVRGEEKVLFDVSPATERAPWAAD